MFLLEIRHVSEGGADTSTVQKCGHNEFCKRTIFDVFQKYFMI